MTIAPVSPSKPSQTELRQHTPTPWAIASNARAIVREVSDMADGYDHYMVGVMSSHSLIGHEEAKANAAFIVDCVNSHASLKARIEELEGEATSYHKFWIDERAKRQELEGALKPFAVFADRFGEHAREDGWQLTNNPSGKGNLTMGDCRNARAACRGD